MTTTVAPILCLLLTACSSARPPARETPRHDAGVVADAAVHVAVTPDARGRVVITETDECGFILDMIYFPANSALPPNHQTVVLDQTAETFRCFARTEPGKLWEIQGHADPYEPDALALSEARAAWVRDELVKRGVAPTSLVLKGYAATLPLDRSNSDFAHAKNRRVMFIRR